MRKFIYLSLFFIPFLGCNNERPVNLQVKYMFYSCEYCAQFKVLKVFSEEDKDQIGQDIYIIDTNKNGGIDSNVKVGADNIFNVIGTTKPQSIRELILRKDSSIQLTSFKEVK